MGPLKFHEKGDFDAWKFHDFTGSFTLGIIKSCQITDQGRCPASRVVEA